MALNLPAWCESWIGLPYLKDGRQRSGLDCWGYFALLQRERHGFDIAEYDGPSWSKDADVNAIAEAARAFAQRFAEVEPGEESEGDGVLFNMMGAPMHIGYVVRKGLMLHIEEACDSCAERYTDRAWAKRIAGFYRAKPGA